MASTLVDMTAGIGLTLSTEQARRLERYRDMLAGAGFNLTSLRDRDAAEIERRHVVESLAFGVLLVQRGLLAGPVRVLDVGAGAGLPGLPLKVAWPELRLTLLESTGKKCRFMAEAARELGLEDVSVVEGRAEELGHNPELRESFDLVFARAVAALPVLLEYSLPFLRAGGRLAAAKGSAALEEIDASARALEELGGRLEDVPAFEPPGGVSQRVVLVEKVAPTPERYPRRSGIPSKRPLR